MATPALVIDTSPLIALYLGEPTAPWVAAKLAQAERHVMSTINLTECLIILRLRRPRQADALAQRLLASSIDFVPTDRAQAELAAAARDAYPLNLGDCFAYAIGHWSFRASGYSSACGLNCATSCCCTVPGTGS